MRRKFVKYPASKINASTWIVTVGDVEEYEVDAEDGDSAIKYVVNNHCSEEDLEEYNDDPGYIWAYESDDDIEASTVCANLEYGEEPYGFVSKSFDRYNNEDWAYYISQELDYDADTYQELLADINNLRAGEWISDNMLNGLNSQALDAFKKFINY